MSASPPSFIPLLNLDLINSQDLQDQAPLLVRTPTPDADPASPKLPDLPDKTKARLRKTPRPNSPMAAVEPADIDNLGLRLEKVTSVYHLSPRGAERSVAALRPPEMLKPYRSEPSTSAAAKKSSAKNRVSRFSAHVDNFLISRSSLVLPKKKGTAFHLPKPPFLRRASKDTSPTPTDPLFATFSRFINCHTTDAIATFIQLSHDETSPLLAPYQANVKKFSEWLNSNTSKRHSETSKVSTICNDTARCIGSLKTSSISPNSFNSHYSQDRQSPLNPEKIALRGWMFQLFDLPPEVTANAISQLRLIAEPAVLKKFEYHSSLKDEAGNLVALSSLSKIHPSEFLRTFSNAASFILTTSDGALPIEMIPSSYDTVGKMILSLDKIFDGPFFGLEEESSCSSSILTEEMINALIKGYFSADDFHMMTPDEKTDFFKFQEGENQRQEALRIERQEKFRLENPVLSEHIKSLFFELFQVEEPYFTEIIEELNAHLKQFPDKLVELRRLFFDLYAGYQKKQLQLSKNPGAFEALPIDIAIKKLFSNKKKEIVHLLQLLTINAFKLADLLFREEFGAYKTHFSLSNSERKMQYKLHCHNSSKWSVSLTKWIDVISASSHRSPSSTSSSSPSSSSSSSSTSSQRALATMSYSLKLEIDPFSPNEEKVSSCGLKVESLQFYPGDKETNEQILNLAMLFCFGRSFERISNKRLARHTLI